MSNKAIVELKDYDPIDFIDNIDDIKAYIEVAANENDPIIFLSALNDVARAFSIKKIAQETGVNRESLYKSLNGSVMPRFDTVCKVLNSLGMRISVQHIDQQL